MIVIDCIAFGLQKSGGISVVWYELISRLLMNRCESIYIISQSNSKNLFYKLLRIPKKQQFVVSESFFQIRRYFPLLLSSLKEPFIFHSTYYRYSRNSLAINITTIHDFTYEYYVKGWKKKLHIMQKYAAIRRSDYIICISEHTKRDLLKFLPDIDPNKVCVIYNGVSDDYCIIASDKSQLPYPKETYFLFVGGRDSYKNFKFAVDIVSHTNYNLIIVGASLTASEQRYLNEKLPLERYSCVGRISNEYLNILYNSAFALLYPSSYEGFGIPVLEAQKAGCPVMAYNSSSIPEVIGDSSLLMQKLDLSEAHRIISMFEDKVKRRQIVDNGLENAKRFTWDTTFQQLLDVYDRALNRKHLQ